MMVKRILYLFLLSFLVLVTYYFYFNNKKKGKGADDAIGYEMVTIWPQLPDSVLLGNPTGIGIDTAQNILVFHRAGREWPLMDKMPDEFIKANTVLSLDRKSGRLLKSWGGNLFIMPHGLTVDGQNNVWLTDVGLHQVFKFDAEGKLLMKLGEAKVPGSDSLHFNQPTDVAVANDGSFYVSDGYGNNRIIKFSAEGKFLFQWGKPGSAEGELDIPHGITLDEKQNVYVADRGNERIQVFDSNGMFLRQYKEESFGEICSVAFDEVNKKITAVDDARFLQLAHLGSDVMIFDVAGLVQNRFGRSGNYDGPKCWYHDVVVDNEGTIYVGDILGNRVQKFRTPMKNK